MRERESDMMQERERVRDKDKQRDIARQTERQTERERERERDRAYSALRVPRNTNGGAASSCTPGSAGCRVGSRVGV